MIKNLEELKQYNIICTNTEEVEECLDILEKLGFKTDKEKIYSNSRIVKSIGKDFFSTCIIERDYKDINFYQFKKQTKKFLKEKEKQLPDFEVASDGRITKINNWNSENFNFLLQNINLNKNDIENLMQLGLIYQNKFLEKATEKQKIYTQLKNLAERLNNGEKFDWNNSMQRKYCLCYNYEDKELSQEFIFYLRQINEIYCLDENFLEIAKKEIGEENLLKLFDY